MDQASSLTSQLTSPLRWGLRSGLSGQTIESIRPFHAASYLSAGKGVVKDGQWIMMMMIMMRARPREDRAMEEPWTPPGTLSSPGLVRVCTRPPVDRESCGSGTDVEPRIIRQVTPSPSPGSGPPTKDSQVSPVFQPLESHFSLLCQNRQPRCSAVQSRLSLTLVARVLLIGD
ncbi:hypothetical protein VTO42DRAFT_2316 [Malbranchea cinnamomea]